MLEVSMKHLTSVGRFYGVWGTWRALSLPRSGQIIISAIAWTSGHDATHDVTCVRTAGQVAGEDCWRNSPLPTEPLCHYYLPSYHSKAICCLYLLCVCHQKINFEEVLCNSSLNKTSSEWPRQSSTKKVPHIYLCSCIWVSKDIKGE